MSCRQGIKRCCRAETGWLWKAHSGSVQKVEVWCSKEDKQRNWFLKQRPGACLGHASRGAYLTGIPRHKQTVTTRILYILISIIAIIIPFCWRHRLIDRPVFI